MKDLGKKGYAKVYSRGKNACIRIEGKLFPFNDEAQLFKSGRKWWLHYGYDRNTGSFPSKKRAMAWYTNGGR